MAAFTVEIGGAEHDRLAQDLQQSILTHQGQVRVFTETERTIDPLTALSVVLSAMQAADLLWQWWQRYQQSGATVTIRTAGGKVITLDHLDHHQLAIVLQEDE